MGMELARNGKKTIFFLGAISAGRKGAKRQWKVSESIEQKRI